MLSHNAYREHLGAVDKRKMTNQL